MKKITFFFSLLVAFLGTFFTATVFGADAETASVVGGAVTYASKYIKAPQGSLAAYVGSTGAENGPVQVITTERERAIYQHNQQRFGGKHMVPDYLRLEATIKNASNTLRFQTFVGDGATVYATERRLDRNDSFIATELGMFLLRQDVANAKTNGKLHTYVNLVEFAAAAGFVPADLEALYAGQLKFNIDRKDVLIGLDTQRFRYVPETQQSGAGNYDQRRSKDGFIKLTPQIVLKGNATNELELNFPSYAGWSGAAVAAGIEHRVVLYMRGLLVSGGANM